MSIVEHKENYYRFNLRLEYIAICEGGKESPHCKAMLLGILEDQIALSRANQQSDYILITLQQWTKLALVIYSKQIIARCLTEMVEDQLILRRPVVVLGLETYEYTLNIEKINGLLKDLPQSLFEQYHPQSTEPELPISNYPQNLIEGIPANEWQSRGEQSGKVHKNNARAKKQGLPATLTTVQWIETVSHYQWKCAICQTRPYQVLEHFIPLALGNKGTSADNCIPTCSMCNRIKGDVHPLALPASLGWQSKLEEIQAYLATREEAMEGDDYRLEEDEEW